MRSFEVPPMKACMLTEETPEHIDIFGADSVPFFRTPDELVEQSKFLIKNPELRINFAEKAFNKVSLGNHTYTDRLATIISAMQHLS